MTACPVCRQSGTFVDFELDKYQVWACRRCGFRHLEPQPTDAELASIYSESYFLDGGDAPSSQMVNRLKGATAELYLHQLLAEAPDLPARPRLLEIGCGRGDFLLAAKARGFNVVGLEVTDHLVTVANQRLGIPSVQKGHLEQSHFETESFDVVAFFDVIEHVRDPRDFLKRVRALLRPSGLAFIVTPSLDSWSARILGRHWMEFKVEHLSYFNRQALRRLLDETGFRRLRFLPNYKVLSFDYIDRHFVRFPVGVVSPLLHIGRNLMPTSLAHEPFRVMASGMAVTAQKGANGRPDLASA